MWGKKAFLLAAIVLTLTSAANADLVLTLNGFDTTTEFAEIKGKDNLVIAVAGDTEVYPNAYRIEAAGGVLKAKAGPTTASPQAKNEEYSFTFEDELALGTVSLIANNDMVIDGTSVKEGDTIYELSLFYISETDTVISCGLNLEILSCILPEPEPEPEPQPEPNLQPEPELQLEPQPQPEPVLEPQPVPELKPESKAEARSESEPAPEPQPVPELKPEPKVETQPELGPVAESQPKAFLPFSKQKIKRLNKLKNYSKVTESLIPKDWGFKDWGMKREILFTKENTVLSPFGRNETIDGADSPTEFSADTDFIEIPAGSITENTIWDSNVVLLGCVEVNNAMLIIKPGVEVRITDGEDGGIIVRNNGCIIANGTPDNMICFFPTSWYPYLGYGCAIKLEETASPLCEISYCTIGCAYIGILSLNKRLENPIHDNSIWDCTIGIAQDGPMLTDVVNNEIFDPTDPEEIAPLLPIGIGASLADACGVAANTAEIYIGNNTIAGDQTYGIYISGVEDPNEAGTVTIANDLIAGSRDTAIYLVNGWMRSLVICNGFYANYHNMNVSAGGSAVLLGNGSGDSNAVAVVEDFNEYTSNDDPRWQAPVWHDYHDNSTGAAVYLVRGIDDASLVRGGNSMEYDFDNTNSQGYGYYSEAEADVCDLPSGIGSDWTVGDANTLTLYFYGQAGNDTGEQMYVKLTDGDENDFNSVDNFDSYTPNDIYDVWHDYHDNSTGAAVYLVRGIEDPIKVRGGASSNSMRYDFDNATPKYGYYSEAYATIGTGTGELNIDPDWLGLGAQTLSLWFYGTATNDANEQMYIKLVDSDNPVHTATVVYRDYGDMNDIRNEKWHQWNIPLTDFNGVNLANVAKITIGFGDGTTPAASVGIVYFDDIRLYTEYPPRPHTAKVVYLYNNIPYNLMEQWWHVWNIPFTELNGVNLANVKSIAIGFGDGNAPYASTGTGTVYFDDIILGNGSAEEPFYNGFVYLDEDPFVTSYLGPWPLYLKQGCPLIDANGGNYIDEYPYLVGKSNCVYWDADTNSYREIPDTNVVNIGFHYNFDRDYINNGCGSADLDYSNTADLRDFAIFAYYWLQETSGPADLDGSGFVDYNDLALFAEGWRRTEAMYVEGYSFDTQQPADFCNISGDISIWPENIPPDAREVFIYVDDVQVSRWERGISEWAGFFESDKFTNGQHTIRLVSINLNDSITNYQPINSYFNNLLYKVSADERFYPDRNYHLSGFYDGGNSLDVNITDTNGTVLWSNTYNAASYIDFNIPGSAFGTEQTCKVNITSDSCSISICSTREFRIEDVPSNVKALVIAPDSDVRAARQPAIDAYINACTKRHLPYQTLYEHDVNEGNLTSLLTRESVKYIYWVGHGDSHIISKDGKTKVQRTYTHCWEELPLRWIEKFVFSMTGIEPPLPDGWDVKGVNLSLMKVGGRDEMHDSSKKKIVFIDCCKSALPYMGGINDMAAAYGMNSLQGQGSLDQIYIGWRANVSTAIWDKFADDLTAGVKLFWDRMGREDDGENSVGAALEWTCQKYPSTICWESMWGLNHHTDFFDVDGDDNIFVWGLGIGNLYEIRLEP